MALEEQAGYYVSREKVERDFEKKLTDTEWRIVSNWIYYDFSEYYDQEINHWKQILPEALEDYYPE